MDGDAHGLLPADRAMKHSGIDLLPILKALTARCWEGFTQNTRAGQVLPQEGARLEEDQQASHESAALTVGATVGMRPSLLAPYPQSLTSAMWMSPPSQTSLTISS